MADEPESWDAYFGSLAKQWAVRQRSRHWLHVNRVHVEGFPEGDCHNNAGRYVADHGGMVVHGYVFLHPLDWDAVQVIPHSIVRMPDGRLVDPTPNEVPPAALPFLEHERLDVPFERVVKNFAFYNVKI